jgi:FkbM family methyltransferase
MKSLIRRITNKIYPPKKPLYRDIKVGLYTLKAVYDAQLDGYLLRHPNYSVNFAKLSYLVTAKNRDTAIIDVGANMGDTVALLRSQGVQNKIYCIEGNSVFFDLLVENSFQFQEVKLINYFLSDGNETIKTQVKLIHGTAQYKKTDDGQEVSTKSLDSLLDDEMEGATIGILKVDTDGYDVAIINGANKLLTRDQPVIFFEYDPKLNSSAQTCLQLLLSLTLYGYYGVIFYDNFGTKLIHTTLLNTDLITQLDKYISNSGAFPYYDVAVFAEKDALLFEEITSGKYNL